LCKQSFYSYVLAIYTILQAFNIVMPQYYQFEILVVSGIQDQKVFSDVSL